MVPLSLSTQIAKITVMIPNITTERTIMKSCEKKYVRNPMWLPSLQRKVI